MVESVENRRVTFEDALNMLVLAWLLSRKCPEWSRVSRILVLNSPHEWLLWHQQICALLECSDLFERVCGWAEVASRYLVRWSVQCQECPLPYLVLDCEQTKYKPVKCRLFIDRQQFSNTIKFECAHVLTLVVGDDIAILISLFLNLPLLHYGVQSITPQLVRAR